MKLLDLLTLTLVLALALQGDLKFVELSKFKLVLSINPCMC